MPLSICCILLVSSVIISKEKWKTRLRWLGILSLLFFSNPLLSTIAINTWEPIPKQYHEIQEKYDWAVVLAGITNPNRPPYDRVHFNRGADRIVHAIDLYKAGVVKKILISGGSGVLSFEGKKESHALAAFAISCGVEPNDLVIEDQSRNTRENALFSKKLLEKDSNVLLFTSAFHMRRALGCFHTIDVKVSPFPTDYYGKEIRFTPDDIIVPKYQSLQLWSILIKEWAGLTAYKLAGYI